MGKQNNMPKLKIIFGLSLFLLLIFFVVPTVSAGLIRDCDCVLLWDQSTGSVPTCNQQSKSLCINSSFIDNVVNQTGENFHMALASGLTVTVTDNSFSVNNCEKLFLGTNPLIPINKADLDINFNVQTENFSSIYFDETNIENSKTIDMRAKRSIYAPSRIIRSQGNITMITTEANSSIAYGYIYIYEPTGTTVSLTTGDGGAIKGTGVLIPPPAETGLSLTSAGDIFNQPDQSFPPEAGPGGNIYLKAKIINVGNLLAGGYENIGGNVEVYGEEIKTDSISTFSVERIGLKLFGKPGRLFIARRPNPGKLLDLQVKVFRADNLFAQGMNSRDAFPAPWPGVTKGVLDIYATDYIKLLNIDTRAGCEGKVRQPCDYGNLCAAGAKNFRKFYSPCYEAAHVGLDVESAEGDKFGIWVGGNIDTSAWYQEVDSDGTYGEGVGMAGKIALNTRKEKTLIRIDGSIKSVGAHLLDRRVVIWGQKVWIKGSITTDTADPEVQAFKDEMKIQTGGVVRDMPLGAVGAGEINIRATDHLILDGDISAQGKHPFMPNGGKVEITNNTGGPIAELWTKDPISINTSGYSGSGIGVEWGWAVKEGVSVDGANNPILINNFCGDGTKEYYNASLDPKYSPSDGFNGGDGGNVTIRAEKMPIKGISLIIKAKGGEGSLGGKGGEGGYCSGFTGNKSNVIPISGYGGKGANGGKGGKILVAVNGSAAGLSCFEDMSLYSNGGDGGRSGESDSSEFSYYTSRVSVEGCDLQGWDPAAGVVVPESKPPAGGGIGGDGGMITVLAAQPATYRLDRITARSFGGNAGSLLIAQANPYPFYCSDIPSPNPDNNFSNLIQAAHNTFMKNLDNAFGNPATETGGCFDNADPDGCWCSAVVADANAAAKEEGALFYDATGIGDDNQFCGHPDDLWSYTKEVNNLWYSANNYFSKSGCTEIDDFYDRKGNHDQKCRPKIVQTPCQSKGFLGGTVSPPKEGYYWLPPGGGDSGFKVAQSRAGAFTGSGGADGGSGASIEIDALLKLGGTRDCCAAGGRGGPGSLGQDAFVDKPGDGGPGGKGGDGASVRTPMDCKCVGIDPTLGGLGGQGGSEGAAAGMKVVRADYFCASADFGSYKSIGVECNQGQQIWKWPCGVDFLDSSFNRDYFGCDPNRSYQPGGGFLLSDCEQAKLCCSAGNAKSCSDVGVKNILSHEVGFNQTANKGTDGAGGVNGMPETNFPGASAGTCDVRPPIPGFFTIGMPKFHNVCYDEVCIEVIGDSADECSSDDQCLGSGGEEYPLPTAILTVEYQKCCDVTDGIGAISFQWKDVGPGGVTYQFQIDDDPAFNSPEVDRQILSTTTLVYVVNLPLPADRVAYGTNYYVRVKGVPYTKWTEYDESQDTACLTVSGNPTVTGDCNPDGADIDGNIKTFTTVTHPYPRPKFSWTPSNPDVDAEVSFSTDTSPDVTLFYDGVCDLDPDDPQCGYSWTFPDGTPVLPDTVDSREPKVTFNPGGAKTVKLEVTDSSGYTCPKRKDIGVGVGVGPLGPPKWKEITPF